MIDAGWVEVGERFGDANNSGWLKVWVERVGSRVERDSGGVVRDLEDERNVMRRLCRDEDEALGSSGLCFRVVSGASSQG